MSPDPENPQQGKAGDTSPEDAAAAKSNVEETPAQPEPSASEAEAAPQAEGTAAAETGIDKLAANLDPAEADGDEPAAEVVDPGEPEDQQERVDAEAARAAAAAEEAAAAAEDTHTPVAEAAAAEAEELAEQAEAEAEAAVEEPKNRRARRARAAEQAADQAEEAADEAKDSARRSRVRRGRTPEEPKAVPVGLKVSAQAKYVRTSARKARLVCDHIRGKDVEEARAILAFTTRGAAKAWIKLLESAVANAEHNHELLGEDLRIFNVHADEGPTLKRYRPRAMGRATRIRKRTSHLSITLTPKES
jgi:ribosomal protein L22